MNCKIITTSPDFFESPLRASILGRAVREGKISVEVRDLHDWGEGAHRAVDDTPYGGGAGMVIRADILEKAINELKTDEKMPVVFFSPVGKALGQCDVESFTKEKEIIVICGHFEGIDERAKVMITHEFRVGDFVMTGGEIPALAFIDAVVRHIPGVLGNAESLKTESFGENMRDEIEAPCFTRPAEWRGVGVPDVLRSGDHAEIEKWRRENRKKIK